MSPVSFLPFLKACDTTWYYVRHLCWLQVVIIPILKKNTNTDAVLRAAEGLAEAATSAGIRAKVDAGTEKTPGFKFSFWEMKACLSATIVQH